MHVRVEYTIEVSDEFRRALNRRYGRAGLASRSELKSHFRDNGCSLIDDVLSEYEEDTAQAEKPQ